MTRWNLSVRGTPEATRAAWTASSTLDLKAAGLGLQTVRVTSGMVRPKVVGVVLAI